MSERVRLVKDVLAKSEVLLAEIEAELKRAQVDDCYGEQAEFMPLLELMHERVEKVVWLQSRILYITQQEPIDEEAINELFIEINKAMNTVNIDFISQM